MALLEDPIEPFDLALFAPQLTSPTLIDQLVVDSRRISSRRALFVALPGKQTHGHNYVQEALGAGATHAIVDLTFPQGPHLIRVPDPLLALQEIARLYRLQRKATVVGITGSVGKTLLKDLLQAILSKSRKVFASPGSFNSQCGVPLSLLQIKEGHDLALVEAGISKPGEMDRLASMLQPDHAIITRLDTNHIATLGSQEIIAQEKLKLAQAVSPQGWTLMPQLPSPPPLHCAVHLWNSSSPHLPQLTTSWETDLSLNYKIQFPDTTFVQQTTQGYAYVPNLFAMAASAAWLLGATAKQIAETLQGYQPELMRTELFQTTAGAWIINNPYCSDPQSLENSLRHFMRTGSSGKKTVLFGGIRDCPEKKQAEQFIAQNLSKARIHLIEGSINTKVPEMAHGDTLLLAGPTKARLETVMETFEEGLAATTCFIDLSAIEHNLNLIRMRLQPHVQLMAVVKAVGYGTDARLISTFLESCGVRWLGVSLVEEGASLRRQGVSQNIFCLNVAPYEVRKAVKTDLEVGVDSIAIIDALEAEATKQNKQIRVHLHIDTGMGRFGCRPEMAKDLAYQIRQCPHLLLNGIFSHYPSAEDPSQDLFTENQDRLLEDALKSIGEVPYTHVSNSAGILRHGTAFNMVRIGLAMYGFYPGLKPALTLTSRIAGITQNRAGDTVSYGRTYQLSHDAKIAVIPIGYADGLQRRFEQATLLIRGQPAPIVGRICMDYCMVDVTHIPHVQPGDPILVFGTNEFGHHVSAESLAKAGHCSVHELISCLGPRIKRIFTLE